MPPSVCEQRTGVYPLWARPVARRCPNVAKIGFTSSGRTTPITRPRVVRARLYPSVSAAESTALRVFAATPSLPFRTRLAVAWLTPAVSATAARVTLIARERTPLFRFLQTCEEFPQATFATFTHHSAMQPGRPLRYARPPMAATRAIDLKTAVPGPRSREVLARLAASVASPLAITFPVVAAEARGATITDVAGN